MTENTSVAGSDDLPRRVAFGLFELDRQSGELRKGGAKVRLQEQPLRLLSVLLERPGEIFTREDLRQRLWPADTFVDFDHSLNTAVRKLRAALDDSAETPRFIETVARRGYRFIAPVGVAPASSRPPESGPEAGATRRRWIIVASVIVVIAAIALLYALRRQPRIDAIAVLPLVADARESYVAEGLTQSLINDLSQLASVRVMAWTTVSRYAARDANPRRVGSELDVAAVVNGTLKRNGDRVRVAVELIDTKDGAQMWGRSYERGAAELSVLQREIAADIARRISGKPVAQRGSQTSSAEAYDRYLKGLYLLHRRSRAELEKAVEQFEAAITLDPGFALAYAGLAQAYGLQSGNRYVPPSQGTLRGKAAAEKALSLDDTVAEAWASLAAGKSNYFWDFEGAERDFRRALELNPGYADAHQWYATHLWNVGRHDEARAEMALALKLDPLSRATSGAYASQLYFDRRYDDATAFVRQRAELDPNLAHGTIFVRCYLAQGKFDEAARAARTFYRDAVASPQLRAELDAALERGGGRAFFEAWLAQYPRNARQRYVAPMLVATLHAALGHREETFVWLERAYQDRSIIDFYEDPVFDSVRSDPRFTALAKRIGLPQVK